MKIGLQTWGTAGDVRPFIALAGGLSAAGHEVTLAYTDVDNKDYADWAQRGGFRIERVGWVDPGAGDLRSQILATINPLRQWELVMRSCLDPLDDEIYQASTRLCADNDAVVGHGLVHHLQVAAEKCGVPYVKVMLQMNSAESRFVPPATVPDLGPWVNVLSWELGHFMVDRVLKERFNRLRRKEGLPLLSHALDGQVPRHPHLHAYSPTLRSAPRDWSPLHQVCGFLNVPVQREAWDLPEGLSAFLRTGEAPVFLGFGSANDVDPSFGTIAETARLLSDAALQAGCRAIVQAPWSKIEGFPRHPDIYPLEQGPHSVLFPHCSLVVHHGGAGTTHTAVQAGCPSIVVIHWLDQTVWARRLHQLGAAPRPLSRRNLTARRLARAIRGARANPKLRRRARALAAGMRKEDGVKAAVAAIESWLGQPRPSVHLPPASAALKDRDLPVRTAVGH